MRRSAFTLVELIFTIVIIGVLAAVAIPNFKNLKQNAEVKAAIKTTMDTASSAAAAAVNQVDLEDGNGSDINLSSLVNVKGKGWKYITPTSAGAGSYEYNNTKNTGTIAKIDYNGTARTVFYKIDCTQFIDTLSISKCKSELNTTTDYNATITF